MTIYHGKEGAVQVDGNDVAEVTEFTLEEVVPTVSRPSMGDTFVRRKTGIQDGSGSLTCNWDQTDTNGQEAITVGSSVSLILYPQGNTTGEQRITVTVLITKVNHSQSSTDLVTRAFEFENTSAVVVDQVPA